MQWSRIGFLWLFRGRCLRSLRCLQEDNAVLFLKLKWLCRNLRTKLLSVKIFSGVFHSEAIATSSQLHCKYSTYIQVWALESELILTLLRSQLCLIKSSIRFHMNLCWTLLSFVPSINGTQDLWRKRYIDYSYRYIDVYINKLFYWKI